MKKKKYILFFFISFLLIIFIILNQNTTRLIGINHKIIEYKIPIYLKILDFFDRHYNYKFLVKNININIENDIDLIVNTVKWISENIKKIPPGVDVVDHHTLTIVERRLGSIDQYSDLLSVLLVYAKIDSFYIPKLGNHWHPLTIFKINDYWSLVDPYYGIFFINKNNKFSSLEELKNENWEIFNLEFKKINELDFQKIFGDKFKNIEEVVNYYDNLFLYLPSATEINNTHIFDLGGRSYSQNPYGRLKYEIFKILKNL
tara:strand:- start:248 stop:1024 length:777 start_codon:yes stop_codon:yes gene_type:complete